MRKPRPGADMLAPIKKGGQKPYERSKKDQDLVESMAGYGIPQEDIARVVGISPPTLRKYYPSELATGATKTNQKVAERLFQHCMGTGQGSVTACIFWLKTRARWSERMEITGAEGAPLLDVNWKKVPEGKLREIVGTLGKYQELTAGSEGERTH
jgi:hypothetical protein